jgi:hypothetical protein
VLSVQWQVTIITNTMTAHAYESFSAIRIEKQLNPVQREEACGLHSGSLNCRAGVAQSIVSDYRLDDQDSIPGRGKEFSPRLCVQTSSEAIPATYPMGTGGHFPGESAVVARR